jgi:nucleoside-diphosphate-sugar epimerase
MRLLITGAAGNLGGMLARHLLENSSHQLNLMVHKMPLPDEIAENDRVSVYRCDLGDPSTLKDACKGVDAIVHFAGVLFAPGPEKFLPTTNTGYARNLIDTAVDSGVGKFIIISFPHVEGPTSKERPCTDRQDIEPVSVHARTRLAAEKYLFERCKGTHMAPVSLRAGMVYGKDVLMVAFARKLAKMGLLAVWKDPTPIHLISIDDFNACCQAAAEDNRATGIYPLGDDAPCTLQEFLDFCCTVWGLAKPFRVPLWSVYAAAWMCETYARIFRTMTPFTVDFIRIGRVPYCCDTSRMKKDLLPELKYPALLDGKGIL